MGEIVWMIPLAKPYFDGAELNYLKQCLDSGYVSEGPMAAKFSEQVAKFVNVKHAIPVTSCTAALWLALKALVVGRGDEVVVPAYTYPATAHVASDLGATVKFCDVDMATYNTTLRHVKEVVTDRTKVIIPVHLFGLCSTEIDKICKFANDNEIFVVEDAACALGAKWNGQVAGTFGDIGCYAFHARKVITTGEGGMLVTNNDKLAEKLRLLKRFGFDGKRDFLLHGLNFKMADILAAVGCGQMDKANEIIEGRRGVAKYYNKVLKLGDIQTPVEPEGAYHLYQAYVVRLVDHINRDQVIEEMKKRGIECQIGTYAVPITTAYGYPRNLCDKGYHGELYKNTIKLYEQCLALPCWYGLKKEQLEKVVEALNESIQQ